MFFYVNEKKYIKNGPFKVLNLRPQNKHMSIPDKDTLWQLTEGDPTREQEISQVQQNHLKNVKPQICCSNRQCTIQSWVTNGKS